MALAMRKVSTGNLVLNWKIRCNDESFFFSMRQPDAGSWNNFRTNGNNFPLFLSVKFYQRIHIPVITVQLHRWRCHNTPLLPETTRVVPPALACQFLLGCSGYKNPRHKWAGRALPNKKILSPLEFAYFGAKIRSMRTPGIFLYAWRV